MNLREKLLEMELGLGIQKFLKNSLFMDFYCENYTLQKRFGVFLNKVCFKVFTFILVKSYI